MSADAIILTENLGKKYRVAHQDNRARYSTLREVVSQKAKAFFSDPGQFLRRTESFEQFWALKDVSLEVKQGEVVGVIGRNGAGKSTLLKILSRITEPTEGCVRIRGRVASLLEVGTGFHQELTGRENIFLNGAILGMTRAEIRKKFDEIVAFAEVEKFLDTPVKWYSSGMYVRLAFAVAAHLEPEILIVDEVLAVGDAQFQKKCLGKMQSVSTQEGRTVLFVSHNMGAVAQLTSRCFVLANGQVVYTGESEAAIEKYYSVEGNEAKTVFDVEYEPRRFTGNQSARIISLRFERNPPQFSSDEPFSFVIKVRANEMLPHFRTSITIFSSDGLAIGGVFSPDSHQIQCSQEAEFRVTLPCPNLAPGGYYCGVGIGRGNPENGHVDYDVVLETLQFEVRPRTGEDGTVGYWTSGWGRVMFPSLHLEHLECCSRPIPLLSL